MKNIIVSSLLLLAISFLSGCSTKMYKDELVAHNVSVINKYQSDVYVHAKGNRYFSNYDFTKAVEESISESSLFKKIVDKNDSNYMLEVAIVTMDTPVMGFNMTVAVEISWSLRKSSNNAIVMRKTIKTSSTKTPSDAFAGITRLKLAIGSAVSKNIELGLQDISKLEFDE